MGSSVTSSSEEQSDEETRISEIHNREGFLTNKSSIKQKNVNEKLDRKHHTGIVGDKSAGIPLTTRVSDGISRH